MYLPTRRHAGAIAVLLAVLFSLRVVAAGPEDDFRAGVAAFAAGDFAAAVRSFEAARAGGIDTPALHYNLGVALYRLARLEQAAGEFELARQDPRWQALAAYNLGLIANRQGRREAAVAWFQEALRTTRSEKIAVLASTMLQRLGAEAPLRWRYAAEIGGGYDSNASLTASGQVVGLERNDDGFVDVAFNAGGPLLADNSRWKLVFDLYALDYFDLDDFDQTLLGGEIRHLAGAGEGWRSSWGGRLDWLGVAGHGAQWDLSAWGRLQQAMGAGRRLVLGYALDYYRDLDAAYVPFNGTRHRLSANYSRPWRDYRLAFGYTLEFNQRDDLQSGSDFFSQSPRAHHLVARLHGVRLADWQLASRLSWSDWRYADSEIRGGVNLGRREDDQWQLRLTASHALQARLRLRLRYEHTRRRSTLPEYRYSANVWWAGLATSF